MVFNDYKYYYDITGSDRFINHTVFCYTNLMKRFERIKKTSNKIMYNWGTPIAIELKNVAIKKQTRISFCRIIERMALFLLFVSVSDVITTICPRAQSF